MNEKLTKTLDLQRDFWNKYSTNYKKWDRLTMDFLKPQTDGIIGYVKPQGENVVLDIASGTGEPGISIATMIEKGKVTLTDLSEGMLNVAKEKAEKKGLENIEIEVADACALPFEDNTFDIVSCRLGFLYFDDMHAAAKEMIRVLKPSGRLAATVWGEPKENYWVACMTQNAKNYIELPSVQVGAPGIFSCGESGMLAGILKGAGLRGVVQNELNGKMYWKNAEEYWQYMTENVYPFVDIPEVLNKEKVRGIKMDVMSELNNFYSKEIYFDTKAILVYGQK